MQCNTDTAVQQTSYKNQQLFSETKVSIDPYRLLCETLSQIRREYYLYVPYSMFVH